MFRVSRYIDKQFSKSLYNTGSNVIVAGTAIFNATEPEQVIALLKQSVDTAQARVAAK